MTVDVVVCVADLEGVARLACIQRTFGGIPVHVWIPGCRSAPVTSAERHLLQEHLCQVEQTRGPAPLLLPAEDLLHEAHTIDQIVGRMLRDHPGRRYFARRAGTFMGHRVEPVDPVRVVPFPGVWFLVARGRAFEGLGTFQNLLAGGRVVARYARALACRASHREASVVARAEGAPGGGNDAAPAWDSGSRSLDRVPARTRDSTQVRSEPHDPTGASGAAHDLETRGHRA